jgi:hypothetical protein
MRGEQVQNKRAICLDLLLFILPRDKRVQPLEPWILNVDANNARVEKVQHATPISSKQCSSCPRAKNIIVCFFSGDGGVEILLHAPRLPSVFLHNENKLRGLARREPAVRCGSRWRLQNQSERVQRESYLRTQKEKQIRHRAKLITSRA